MSTRVVRSFSVWALEAPLPIIKLPPSNLTVLIGVSTAAVPQAKLSLSRPLAASSRHWLNA